MTTYASKIWRARNLVEQGNAILVEWATIGGQAESAVCGSAKAYNQLTRKLRRDGYVNVHTLFGKAK